MKPKPTTLRSIEEEVRDLLRDAYSRRINDVRKSISMAKKALDIAHDNNRNLLIAKSKCMLALFYMILSDYKESKKLSEEALQYFEDVNDYQGIADSKFNIASICYKTDHFYDGLQLLLDCLLIYRELKLWNHESRVLKSMGTIYEYLGDVKSAIQSYEDAVAAAKKANDRNLESNAYNPLSGIYVNQGKIKEAMNLIERSIALKNETGDVRGLGFALYGRAKVYIKMGEFAHSEEDLLASKKIHEEMGDKVGLAMTFNKLGALYFLAEDFKRSRVSLHQALDIAEEFNIILIKFKAYRHLYQMAREEGDDKNALHFLEKYILTKESVINTHTHDVIKSFESIAKIRALERESIIQKEKSDIIHRKNVELDSFFYRISHDLKGPINSLEGLNNLVSIDIKDDTSLKYFEMYKTQTNRISKIVMELINLTRMNHQKIEKQLINFHQIVDDCIASYQHLPNFSRIDFIKEIDPQIEFYSEWPVINTIIQNLIENGIKYYREGSEKPFMKISISQLDGKILINTEDNGQGIEPKYHGKIFDMFYRANDVVVGTGLGLYILKRAVERLNGEVNVSSRLGVGSKFNVYLPHLISSPYSNSHT